MAESRFGSPDREGKAPSLSPFADKVHAIMESAQDTYAERNAVYKDNFRVVGNVLTALFPNGRPPLKTPEDYNRWHIFELMIVKLTRYVADFDNPHEDSLVDLIPYIGILGGLDDELRKAAEERLRVNPSGIHLHTMKLEDTYRRADGSIWRRHTAWPKYPAEYGSLPCSNCDGHVTRQSNLQEWRHEDSKRDPLKQMVPVDFRTASDKARDLEKEERRAEAEEDLEDLEEEFEDTDDLLDEE